jgi:predicted nucleotidyltransferase
MIQRFVSACRADERIAAAYLYGSYAEGTADAHSDLDLGLLTTDEAYADFQAGRASFVSQLGEPLFLEDFDLPHVVFVIFADGTEVELTIRPASQLSLEHGAAFRVLLDKAAILQGVASTEPRTGQTEALRRAIYWFWHDLSHFMVAAGRGQLWWAHGQLGELRRSCIDLARLQHDFMAGPEGYWKVDEALPVEQLSALQETFCPLERNAILRSALALIRFYQNLAPLLAQQHGIAYPAALESVMLERFPALEELPPG